MDGILLIDKKEGLSSYDVVKIAKRIYHTRKVGHCGTLDPFATGLLILGVNQGTKVMNFLEADQKEYLATIKLGIDTDTGDKTGNIVKKAAIKPINKGLLEEKIKLFIGKITQTPPIYSAIRVNGKHLYEYARNQEQVEIKKREVTIYDIKIIAIEEEQFTICVRCSKGTYIRTLGVDLAHACFNLAHLVKLRRIRIGQISVDEANTVEELEKNQVHLHAISTILNIKKVQLRDENLRKRVYNGHTLFFNEEDPYLLLMDKEQAIAIYEKIGKNQYHCLRGLFDENSRYIEN